MTDVQNLSSSGTCIHAVEPDCAPEPKRALQSLTRDQLKELGRLIWDKRRAARLSRAKLARAAKLSECTIKFIETARHAPRRATLLSLVAVSALKLSWSELTTAIIPPALALDH